MSLNFFVSGGRSTAVFVRIFRHDPFVDFRLCSLVSFGRSVSIWLARSRSIGLCCVRPWCDAQATAARSALLVFGVCGCGVF